MKEAITRHNSDGHGLGCAPALAQAGVVRSAVTVGLVGPLASGDPARLGFLAAQRSGQEKVTGADPAEVVAVAPPSALGRAIAVLDGAGGRRPLIE